MYLHKNMNDILDFNSIKLKPDSITEIRILS